MCVVGFAIQGDLRQEPQTQSPDLCPPGQRPTENDTLFPIAIVSFMSLSLTAGSSRSTVRAHRRRNRSGMVGMAVFPKRWEQGVLH